MKDLKYIIKRILIGVGIILVLSFLNGCKVKALAPNVSGLELITNIYTDRPTNANNHTCNILDSYDNPTRYRSYGIYYQASNDRYYLGFASDDNGSANTTSYYLENASRVPYISILLYNTGTSCDVKFNFTASPVYYNANDYISGNSIYPGAGYVKESGYNAYAQITSANAFTVNGTSGHSSATSTYNVSYNSEFNQNLALVNANNNRSLGYVNYPARDLITNTVFYQRNIEWNPVLPPEPSTPEFVSWNFYRNIQDGVVVSASVSPEFSNFDTTNYTYQWKFGHDGSWNNLEENQQLLNFKTNGSIYVRILDNNNNSILDPMPTIYINVIGKAATDYDYDIKFSTSYSTSKTQNVTLGITVEEVKTDIEFIPENSLLRYQYKFVPDGEDRDNVVWTTSATANISYTTNVNGTIYARITDSNYNQLYIETLTIPNIGDLAIGVGDTNNNDNNFWTKISSKINYGGPVSSLFILPVKLLQAIYSPISDSNTCSSLHIANLFNISFDLQCVNFKNKLGNDLYNLIDLILAFGLVIGVFKFILKIYNNLISMKEGVD